jgi:hypothetical protein
MLEDSDQLKSMDRGEQAKYLKAALQRIHCMSPHVTGTDYRQHSTRLKRMNGFDLGWGCVVENSVQARNWR